MSWGTAWLVARFAGLVVTLSGMAMLFWAARGLAATEGEHPRLRKGVAVGILGMLISTITHVAQFFR
jgi:ABC-type nickel/cobalt efflux system permease component RcnA